MDVRGYNEGAWDGEAERGNRWTAPAGPDAIEAARRGRWEVLLTNGKMVPKSWFPEMEGAGVLCLASGGGQQVPVFAAGAKVTVFDNSPAQLAQDRLVAESGSLELRSGGTMLAGFPNPANCIFGLECVDETGKLRVRYELPYAAPTSLDEEELAAQIEREEPIEFGHALEGQIGGRTDAGFVISGLYEDRHRDGPVAAYMPTFVATRATKP